MPLTPSTRLGLINPDGASDLLNTVDDTIRANNLILDGLDQAGTFASRPAATAVKQGTLYSATDTSQLFRSDGTNWIEFWIGPKTQQAFQTVALGGGATWAPDANIKYYKDTIGRVHFGGTSSLPSVDVLSGTIATLPAGYRPAGGCVRLVFNYTGTVANSAKVSISSAGVISVSGAGFLASQSYDFGSMGSFRAEN